MTFVIVSISLNLNYQIPLIQLDLRHNLSESSLIRDNFNFHVVNFPSICSNISTAPADGVYISQLKRCSGSWILLSFMESVTNEHSYVWFVLTAGHFICLNSWLVTMCDIWPVVAVSSIMNVICGTGPYLPSWDFVSNSSLLMWTIVCLLFFLLFGIFALVAQMLSSDFPNTYWVSNSPYI